MGACRALEVLILLSDVRRAELMTRLGLSAEEIARWGDISRRMYVPFHDDGIISQFEGYEKLSELDWEDYRTRYGNIQRLDLILEMENDSANRYKLSKQADVLMLFYLFSAEELGELFKSLGYRFEYETIPRNIAYYTSRSSQGSTLSRVVDAWVLARSDRQRAMDFFAEAPTERRERCPAGHHGGGCPPWRHGGNRRSGAARVDGYRSKRRRSATRSGIAAGDRAPRHAHPLPQAFTIDLRLTRDSLTIRGRDGAAPPISFCVDGKVCEFLGGTYPCVSIERRVNGWRNCPKGPGRRTRETS